MDAGVRRLRRRVAPLPEIEAARSRDSEPLQVTEPPLKITVRIRIKLHTQQSSPLSKHITEAREQRAARVFPREDASPRRLLPSARRLHHRELQQPLEPASPREPEAPRVRVQCHGSAREIQPQEGRARTSRRRDADRVGFHDARGSDRCVPRRSGAHAAGGRAGVRRSGRRRGVSGRLHAAPLAVLRRHGGRVLPRRVCGLLQAARGASRRRQVGLLELQVPEVGLAAASPLAPLAQLQHPVMTGLRPSLLSHITRSPAWLVIVDDQYGWSLWMIM